MDKNEIQAVKQDFFLLDQPQREMLGSLEKFFGQMISGHTAYQIKNFIIGQFHTPDRKHRQALRELYARYTGLVQQHYEAKKLQIETGRAEIRLRHAKNRLSGYSVPSFPVTEKPETEEQENCAALAALDVEEAGVDLELKRWQLENLKLSVKETLREMAIFKQELDKLATQRKYDSYEEAEPEYWETQFAIEFLKGKRGEALPPIPNADVIAGQISQSFKKKELTEE